jgi:hypothetical protein
MKHNNNLGASLLLAAKKEPVRYALRKCSPFTREQYEERLKIFFNFAEIEGSNLEEQGRNFLQVLEKDTELANDLVMSYMEHLRERVEKGEITAGTAKTMYTPIHRFTEKHRHVKGVIDWAGLIEDMPKPRDTGNDRIPTLQEIKKLVAYPDRRMKFLVYTMCSSGCRVGAWDYMRWKDIEPKYNKENGELVAAKLIIYAGEPEEYFTFCTPEAYNEIKKWMDFRARHGETITGDSYVYRNLFKIENVSDEQDKSYNNRLKGIAQQGIAQEPKKLKKKTIERLLQRAYHAEGLRNGLEPGQKRYPFKASHFARKWFKTKAQEASLQHIFIEIFIGHDIGIDINYLRLSEQQYVDEYVKAVPFLTIEATKDMAELKEELTKKTEEKDKQLEALQNQLAELRSNVDMLIKQAKQQQHVDDSIMLGDPEILEQEIRSFLHVDESEDGKTAYYRQDYPELTEAVQKMQARRLAAAKNKAAAATAPKETQLKS